MKSQEDVEFEEWVRKRKIAAGIDGTAEVLPYCWLKQRLDCTGVHFAPLGPVLNVPANETQHIDWLGSGAVWPLLEPNAAGAPTGKKKRYVINYSGAFSKNDTWDGSIDYQRIYFATSDNLISWTPQPDQTFSIDSRW